MIDYYSKQKVKASVITGIENDSNNIFISVESGTEPYPFPLSIINKSMPKPGDFLVMVDDVYFVMDELEFKDNYASVN